MCALLFRHDPPPPGGIACSKPDRIQQKSQRTAGQTALSVVLHALVIFGAVRRRKGWPRASGTGRSTHHGVSQPPEPPKRHRNSRHPTSSWPPPSSQGFQTVVATDRYPKDITPIDLDEKPFDPSDFTGKGVEGGTVRGSKEYWAGNRRVFLEAQLDDPVQVISHLSRATHPFWPVQG